MRQIKIFIIILLLPCFTFSQTTISEARGMDLGTQVTVTGIVTNGSEFGVIRYIQDSTAGIAVYPGTGSVDFNPVRGDEITITGTLKAYNQLLEIDPVSSYTVNSSGNNLPEPFVITPSQIAEVYEGQLVKIEDASFTNPGGSFSGSTNYDLTAAGVSFVIRINSSSNLVGEIIPTGVIDIVAIVSQYSFSDPNTGYQLLPRDVDDILLLSSLYFTEVPQQSNLAQNGFTISWETNVASSTEIQYGLTENLELGAVTGDNNVTQHSYSFSNLNAGEIYFVKAISISGSDTTPSFIRPYATVSASSGNIKVYFNHTVDNSVSTGIDAIGIPGTMDDTIISYINKAQQTLDVCVYNNNMDNIVSALNSAYNRGVVVRYVTDDETGNLALSSLNNNIPVLFGNPNGLMHNKILIIDAEDTDNAWVVTGSVNFTDNNLFDDYNNMICLQDQSLAKAYRMEFNEMWGSEGNNYNVSNSRFGADKLDNTPHKFVINNIPVESYFSPSDNMTSQIISNINTADNDLEFALLTFTKNEIGSAVVDAFYNGIDIKGIIENENDNGSEYDFFIENGLNVLPHDLPYDIHHKYAIIDANDTSSNPVLITGSHNWSTSAETKNDENSLIIYDASIVNQYYQEFSARWQELLPTNPPVANDDDFTVVQNIAKEINVTANDDYLAHLALNISIIANPEHGSISVGENNLITYTPNTDYLGSDAFEYNICYDAYPGLCDQAVCNITVDIEQAPVAVNDTISIDANNIGSPSSVTYNVLQNDENPNNVELITSIIKEAAHGNEIMIDSNITYVPEIGFEGKDTVIYQICSSNNSSLCSQGLFIITVGDYTQAEYLTVDDKVILYPNPAQDQLHIVFSGPTDNKVEISVWNMLGKQLFVSEGIIEANRLNVDLSKLSSGIYLFVLRSEDLIFSKKILID